jgi:hypothetical protein
MPVSVLPAKISTIVYHQRYSAIVRRLSNRITSRRWNEVVMEGKENETHHGQVPLRNVIGPSA